MRTQLGQRAQRRSGRQLVTVVVAMLVWVADLWGQDINVRAYLDRNTVPVGQLFTLSVEVSGGSAQLTTDPVLPDMGAFAAFVGSGSSRQIQIVNGQTSISTTLQYRYRATAEGTFRVGPVQVNSGSTTRATEPLDITIVRSGSQSSPARPAPIAPAPNTSGGEIDPNDLFLEASISRRTVYQNQPVIVEYKIYTRVQVSSYSATRLPGTTGFWSEEFPIANPPDTGVEIRDGQRYVSATLKKMALFPTSAGTKTIDPMVVDAEVRIRRRSLDPFADFFRGGSLFGQNVVTSLSAEPLTVDVIPLPDAGRPADFSGLVGSARLSASMDKHDAQTNEALTLRVEIDGSGNLRTVPAPEIDFPDDFEVFPPELREETTRENNTIAGRKTYDYVIVPRTPGTKHIPPIRLSYFDPTSATYRTVETAAITVTVTGDPVITASGLPSTRGTIRALRRDIRFIQTAAPNLTRRERSPFERVAAWLVFGIPAFAVVGAWVTRRRMDRLQADVAYARHRRAARVARKRLGQARSILSANSSRDFFTECSRAMHGFIGDKLNIAEAGLIREEIISQLRQRKVPESAIDAFFDCIDYCDRLRFSPSDASPADMRGFLDKVEQAMTELDGRLR